MHLLTSTSLTSASAGIVLILSGAMLMLWPAVLLAAGHDTRRSLVIHALGSVLVMVGVLSQAALAPHLGLVVLVVAMELLILPVQMRLTRQTRATAGSGRP